MDKSNYTDKDYLSILSNLINESSKLSLAYDPTSENDPAAFILKDISLVGDMLAFYLDKTALETAPATMTQRKVADAYYRMMGYYMSWYRPASTEVTFLNSNTSDAVRLPKYTSLRSSDGSTMVTLIEDSDVSIPANNTPTILKFYEGSVYVDDQVSKLYIVNNMHKLPATAKNIMTESVTVLDSSGSEWTQVQDIDRYPEVGKFYDVYVDEYEDIYVRFSSYINTTVDTIKSITYLSSKGSGTSIIKDSLKDCRIILPSDKVSSSEYSGVQYLSISTNTGSNGSTLGPETPAEDYRNSQFYINTADTLVTVSDYYNAIRRITGMSNCVVTDRVIEQAVGKQPSSPSDPGYLDGLTYKVRWLWENFDYSIEELSIQGYINAQINELKSINLTSTTSLDYYIMTWQPEGVITLSTNISESEADDLLSKICANLASDYHPSKVEFGKGISLVDLIDKIKSYDERIMLADIKPIQYKITNPSKIKGDNTTGDCDDDILNVYIDFIAGEGLATLVSNISDNSRLWTKYNSYNTDGTPVTYSGLRVDPYAPTNVMDIYIGINEKLTDPEDESSSGSSGEPSSESSVDSSSDSKLDPGPLPEGNTVLNPIDFFNELHPYRRISIPRFANYQYFNGDTSALTEFKKYVTINKENIL